MVGLPVGFVGLQLYREGKLYSRCCYISCTMKASCLHYHHDEAYAIISCRIREWTDSSWASSVRIPGCHGIRYLWYWSRTQDRQRRQAPVYALNHYLVYFEKFITYVTYCIKLINSNVTYLMHCLPCYLFTILEDDFIYKGVELLSMLYGRLSK